MASEYIAEIQRQLAAEGQGRCHMSAMGTELEGGLEDILPAAPRAAGEGLPRFYTVLKLAERADKPGQTLADEVESVQRRLTGA
jgi:uncharacterized protein YqgV (UPF0045/DUF77 family)